MTRNVIVLEEWLPVETPQGKGYAFLIELENSDNWYTVILESRAIVTFKQEKVLALGSYTHERSVYDAELQAAIVQITQAFKNKRKERRDARRQSEEDGQQGPRLATVDGVPLHAGPTGHGHTGP